MLMCTWLNTWACSNVVLPSLDSSRVGEDIGQKAWRSRASPAETSLNLGGEGAGGFVAQSFDDVTHCSRQTNVHKKTAAWESEDIASHAMLAMHTVCEGVCLCVCVFDC
jgi:hypothetical protein